MITIALPTHVNEICQLVRQAIIVSCVEDHQNDPQKLQPWLKNKTPENFKKGLFNQYSASFVALNSGTVVGVSQVGRDGYLHLCYVHPNVNGWGYGTLLLKQAEETAIKWGVAEITLESTAAARSFYESHGYHEYREPIFTYSMPGYQYKKRLPTMASPHPPRPT